jgi:hypothetical protein
MNSYTIAFLVSNPHGFAPRKTAKVIQADNIHQALNKAQRIPDAYSFELLETVHDQQYSPGTRAGA